MQVVQYMLRIASDSEEQAFGNLTEQVSDSRCDMITIAIDLASFEDGF